MVKIIVSVNKSEIELFTQVCQLCSCCVLQAEKTKDGNFLLTVSSHHPVNLYQLGFEFGAYAPTFQLN